MLVASDQAPSTFLEFAVFPLSRQKFSSLYGAEQGACAFLMGKEGGKKMKKNIQALIIICMLSFIPVLHVHAEDANNFDDEIIYSIMVDRFLDGDTSNNKDVDMAEPDRKSVV